MYFIYYEIYIIKIIWNEKKKTIGIKIEKSLGMFYDRIGDIDMENSFYKNRLIDKKIDMYLKTFGALYIEGPKWCGFEIKLGVNQIDAAASNLVKINNQIIKAAGKPAKALCVICGLSNAAYKRQDGVYVVPITSLRP